MLLWFWFRDGHRLSGVIFSLRWALMLMAVPFGEQWSVVWNNWCFSQTGLCGLVAVFASEGYSEELLLDVAAYGLG